MRLAKQIADISIFRERKHTGWGGGAIENVNTIDGRRSKSLETESSIAICRPTGDK